MGGGGSPENCSFSLSSWFCSLSSWFCTPGEPKATKMNLKGAKMTPKIQVFGSKMAPQMCANIDTHLAKAAFLHQQPGSAAQAVRPLQCAAAGLSPAFNGVPDHT